MVNQGIMVAPRTGAIYGLYLDHSLGPSQDVILNAG